MHAIGIVFVQAPEEHVAKAAKHMHIVTETRIYGVMRAEEQPVTIVGQQIVSLAIDLLRSRAPD